VTTKVLASSDRTGHFVCALGRTPSGEDVHAVGHGATKEEAERKAFAELNRADATTGQKAVYNYFSYGVASK
jgi:hypothetical protein